MGERLQLAMCPVTEADQSFWFTVDPHATAERFARKVRDQLGYVLRVGEQPIGILQYQFLWDTIPFLDLLYLLESHRRNGYGRAAMQLWEADMRQAGYPMVLVSTQADEEAQHFYRRLGYRDCGCLVLQGCPLQQPMELFLCKTIE